MVRARKQKVPQVPGNPQANYPNRVDIAAHGGQQPIRTPTGMAYGQAGALADAQRGAPLPQAPAQPTLPVQRSPQQQDGQARLAQAIQDAQAMGAPGAPINAPSERPHEPLTAGLPIGAGPGPSGPPPGVPKVADTMRALAVATGDPTLRQLADIAGAENA